MLIKSIKMELPDLLSLESPGFGINLENSPFVLSARPVMGRCFFGGPLFDDAPMEKFQEFYKDIRAPRDILRNPERRKRLARNLRVLRPIPSFFSMNGESDSLLEELSNEIILYKRFRMQRGNKLRNFLVPKKNFEYLLREYVLPFVKTLPIHPCSHGGEPGWSPGKSLETHLPVRSGICFDMQDAYGQATIDYVFAFFYHSLKNFNENERIELAGVLATLSTVRTMKIEPTSAPFVVEIGQNKASTRIVNPNIPSYDACLPQGSPLSMAIFNRMMHPIDEVLYDCARKSHMRYTRWVDDFVVTSPKRTKFDRFERVLEHAQRSMTIAPQKLFFHYQGNFYALGHRINYDRVEKIEDKEEFERLRGQAYSGSDLSETHPMGDMIYGDLDGSEILDENYHSGLILPEDFDDKHDSQMFLF